jgi:hypothetical protein
MVQPGKPGGNAPKNEDEAPAGQDPLRIVRADPKEPADLDLDLGDAAGDHRFGREDIADK